MKLSDVKSALNGLQTIGFQLPNGELVPGHFHVTEIGRVTKHFIDCGGTLRFEEVVSFQLWDSDDYDHRLHPEKLVNIIELSEQKLGIGNHEVEVEYQGQTIQKFALDFDGTNFLLTSKFTDCLAKDQCCAPDPKQKVKLSELQMIGAGNACAPGSGCC
jgi:hypothetical protein